MLLTWTLTLFCCLRVITFTLVGACSTFPRHTSCSSSHYPSEILDRNYLSTIKFTMIESGAMNDTLPKSLRILCFGDSLTAGYTSYGCEFYPYADHLRAGLQHKLSTSDIEVDVAGMSGDQVQGNYFSRIQAKCAIIETPYDWIIIMGGTNDLAWGQTPDMIYEGLSKPSLPLPRGPLSPAPFLDTSSPSTPSPLRGSTTANVTFTERVWKVALDTGANVLALNVLEAEGSGDRENSRRNSLNNKIANHQQER